MTLSLKVPSASIRSFSPLCHLLSASRLAPSRHLRERGREREETGRWSSRGSRRRVLFGRVGCQVDFLNLEAVTFGRFTVGEWIVPRDLQVVIEDFLLAVEEGGRRCCTNGREEDSGKPHDQMAFVEASWILGRIHLIGFDVDEPNRFSLVVLLEACRNDVLIRWSGER